MFIGILVFLIGVWIVLGAFGFKLNADLYGVAIAKRKYMRVFLYIFLSGPFVWLCASALFLLGVYQTFVFYLLQEEPTDE